MPRSTHNVPSHRRRRKLIRMAKGYFGGKKNLFRTAKEAVEKGLQYSYRDRRAKKREFRRLWIARINAAAHLCGISYSRLMNALKEKNILINRKILAEMAVSDFEAFKGLVQKIGN
ncbi:50S ribosomal protein L20 [candidate division KSB1 bacterium]|nr:50S ribosomal protein L20 [candidate division KSB1 bacterium]